LYRPFKQKRRTKATIAKEKGLEPLADWILSFPAGPLIQKAQEFVNMEKEVESAEEALDGAHEIIGEKVGDEPNYRKWIREETENKGQADTKAKDTEKDPKGVFAMYYEYNEPIKNMPPHRILAMNRGEKEGVLSVTL